MVTFVSVGLWILYIVFYMEYGNISLGCDHICDLVNIRCKGADDTDPCNIA